MMRLNLNYADACASLLPSHPEAWWCAHTVGHMAVPVVRLDYILEMLPPEYVLHYLKVDTEGNDLHVLRGAGNYIKKFRYVSAEVDNDPNQKNRLGGNSEQATVDFMTSVGFKGVKCLYKECHFSRHNDTDEVEFSVKLHDIGHYEMDRTTCSDSFWYKNYSQSQKYWPFPSVK
jgi:hypothetical protein